VDLVPERADLTGEGVPVDFGEIGTPFVDGESLKGFPAVFGAVPSEIGGDGVDVELGIELTAGVVVVDGEDGIGRGAVVISAGAAHAGRGVGFEFGEGLSNCALVSIGQTPVVRHLGHDGDGFGSGEGEVVKVPFAAADGTIGGDTIGPMARAKELAGARI